LTMGSIYLANGKRLATVYGICLNDNSRRHVY
jgi:hypothetical protein